MTKDNKKTQPKEHTTRIAKYQDLRSKIDDNFLNLKNYKSNNKLNQKRQVDYFDSDNYLLLSQKIKDLIKRLERVAPYFEFSITNKTDSVENSIKALMTENVNSIHADDIVTPFPLNYKTLNEILKFEKKEIINHKLLHDRNNEMSFNAETSNLKLIIDSLINNSTKLPENMFQKRNELLELLFNIIKEKESNHKNEVHLEQLKKEYYGMINADTNKINKKSIIKNHVNYNSRFIKKLLIISVITWIITCAVLIGLFFYHTK